MLARRVDFYGLVRLNSIFHIEKGFLIFSYRIKDVFTALADPPSIYLAVASDDSSIVYYKLSSGIVKPSV